MGAQGESDGLEHQVGRFSIQIFFCVLASGLFPHGFPSQVRAKLPIHSFFLIDETALQFFRI
jgi:hypothetical protein